MATKSSATTTDFHNNGEVLVSPCSTSTAPIAVSASLAVRAQKNILSKLSQRGVVKHLVDEQILQSIDNLHQVLLLVYPPITANKVIKNILKVTMKLAVLAKEKCFTPNQQATLLNIESQFRGLTLTILSFQAIDYSYDFAFLVDSLDNLNKSISCIVGETLSDKSLERVNFVFNQLSQKAFLDTLFCADTSHKQCLHKLTTDLEKLFETHLTIQK